MDEFTEDEKRLLDPFFTNLDKPVFALINLPEVVKGALFSRYSRTTKSLRRVLLDEFIQVPEMGFKEIVGFQKANGADQFVAIKKAEEFYDRVLVGYGDDSVAELGGAHLAVENVSQIASKVLEDSRIGLSPLEKSTRYVPFDQKVDGQYKYYRDPVIMQSEFADLYVETNDMLFDNYSKLIPEMIKFVSERFPKEEGVTDRAYQSSVRAKALDILRGILPVATFTNVGLFGNGRAFEYLLTKMYAHPLTEIRDIADSMHEELFKIIPSFVKRAPPTNQYGKETNVYLTETHQGMDNLSKILLASKNLERANNVTLVEYDKDAENKVIAAMLYPHSNLPFQQLIKIVSRYGEKQKFNIIEQYMGKRANRRHKPGRALENIYYTFDILANFGAYRDLHRHRALTQQRQAITVIHGYETSEEIIDAGFKDIYDECMQRAAEAFKKIYGKYPLQTQYVVPLSYRVRWYITMNLREVYHFVELRTSQQGHRDYRKIALKIFEKVKEVHPALVQYMKFVDMTGIKPKKTILDWVDTRKAELERIKSEQKIDKKMEEMKKKYGA